MNERLLFVAFQLRLLFLPATQPPKDLSAPLPVPFLYHHVISPTLFVMLCLRNTLYYRYYCYMANGNG